MKNADLTGAGWTIRQVARLTEQPVSTVAFWVANDLVSVDRRGRGRSGHAIGIIGLLEIAAIAELRRVGFSLHEVRRALGNLRELTGENKPLARLALVVIGDDIAWQDASDLEEAAYSALRCPGQRLMVFPIGNKHEEYLSRLQSTTPTQAGNGEPLTAPATNESRATR